jgi:hypothetical protein
MKYILILILIGAVFLTACATVQTQNNQTQNQTNETPIPVEPDGGIGDSKTYISNNTNCVINFLCTVGHQPFKDDKGCGCEPVQTDGKLKAIDCTDPRPEICYDIYRPVCGQVQVQCIRAPCPPVMQTFANNCQACANSLTISYTQGACEDNAAGGTVLAGTNEEQCTNISGTWTGYDCTGITANQCQEIGGTFNECASACRNDPTAEVCTLQCVQVCEFN